MYIYVCIYIYMYVYMYVYGRIWTYIKISIYIYLFETKKKRRKKGCRIQSLALFAPLLFPCVFPRLEKRCHDTHRFIFPQFALHVK